MVVALLLCIQYNRQGEPHNSSEFYRTTEFEFIGRTENFVADGWNFVCKISISTECECLLERLCVRECNQLFCFEHLVYIYAVLYKQNQKREKKNLRKNYDVGVEFVEC